ncbi:MAG: hypothetical protein ABEK04_00355 [Candidatus Nanohalobium sp.]
MEFREGHWANLVFVSTLGSSKTAEEIADAWDVPREKIDRDSIIREAERLEQVKFFEETGDKFLAKTDSQAFKTEVENYFKHEADKQVIKSELELFTKIVKDLEIRKKAFDIESVTQFYGRDAKEAKKNPLAVFEGLLFALDHVLGHERSEELEYNVEVLVDNLKLLESEKPEVLQKI